MSEPLADASTSALSPVGVGVRECRSAAGGTLIAARASATDREDFADSQDRSAILHGRDENTLGVVVCDGVGSQPQSGEVAERASVLTKGFVKKNGLSRWRRLAEEVNAGLEDDLDGATTHIAVALDASGRVRFSFLGDGSLLEVRFREVASGRYRAAFGEAALAQTEFTPRGAALTGYLPSPTGVKPDPVVGVRSPQRRPEPYLWLAVSDGVSSDVDRPLSLPDELGNSWQKTSPALVSVLTALGDTWSALTDPFAGDVVAERLAACLALALSASARDAHLNDDATAAAILWRPVI